MDLRGQLLISAATLLDRFPAVRDGDVEAIHDARVATRRMRAVLPVLAACHPDVDLKSVSRTVRRAGRALGRVRDLDVALALAGDLEQRLPMAAGRTAEVRRALVSHQLAERRHLVKEMDRLPLADLSRLASKLPAGHRFARRSDRRIASGRRPR